jgi:hypothetical protein
MEKGFIEGNPGTDPWFWSVFDVEERFLEWEIQGPTPWFGLIGLLHGERSYREGNPGAKNLTLL